MPGTALADQLVRLAGLLERERLLDVHPQRAAVDEGGQRLETGTVRLDGEPLKRRPAAVVRACRSALAPLDGGDQQAALAEDADRARAVVLPTSSSTTSTSRTTPR